MWSATLAYVGNAARSQLMPREINGRPYGYAYQAVQPGPHQRAGGQAQAQPLPDDLLRPYRGYPPSCSANSLATRTTIQSSLRRTAAAPADGLAFGAAYTYQLVNKTLGDPLTRSCRTTARETTIPSAGARMR